jgi:hypothetical protein
VRPRAPRSGRSIGPPRPVPSGAEGDAQGDGASVRAEDTASSVRCRSGRLHGRKDARWRSV